jgi:hypothetical protein
MLDGDTRSVTVERRPGITTIQLGDKGEKIRFGPHENSLREEPLSGQSSYKVSSPSRQKHDKSSHHQDKSLYKVKDGQLGASCAGCCEPSVNKTSGATPLGVKKLFSVQPDALDPTYAANLVNSIWPGAANNTIKIPTAVAHPIVVAKAGTAPGDGGNESLFVCTQPGKIFKYTNGNVILVADLSFYSGTGDVMPLGSPPGFPVPDYDERGLLGIEFHPQFKSNGRFFVYYSAASNLNPNTVHPSGLPNTPCRPCSDPNATIPCVWNETNFTHSNVLEEWLYSVDKSGNITTNKTRRLLNIKHPFFNHDSLDNLTYSTEIGKLYLYTGDGGFRDSPYTLPQNDNYFHGKAIAIDVTPNSWSGFDAGNNAVAQFGQLPLNIQGLLQVHLKGIRNWSGMTIFANPFVNPPTPALKLMGQPGQDTTESVFLMENLMTYDSTCNRTVPRNIGFPAFEGSYPNLFNVQCPGTNNPGEFTINMGTFKAVTNWQKSVDLAVMHETPYCEYYHNDANYPEGGGVVITGQKPSLGSSVPQLQNKIVVTDWGLNSGTGFPNGLPNDGGLLWRVPFDTQYCRLHRMERVPFNYNWKNDFPDSTFPLTTVGFGSGAHQITRPFFLGLSSNSSNTILYLLAFNRVGSKEVQGLGTVYQITSS